MTRRITAFILICITVLAAAASLSACAPQPAEPAQTQEEFRAEFIERLKNADVLADPNNEYEKDEKKASLGDGIEIYVDKLKLNLHIYSLIAETDYAPTVEEVIGLYQNYDEEINNKFYDFFFWYGSFGRETVRDYKDAIENAYLDAYMEKEGLDVVSFDVLEKLTKESRELSYDEMLELEKYFPKDWDKK